MMNQSSLLKLKNYIGSCLNDHINSSISTTNLNRINKSYVDLERRLLYSTESPSSSSSSSSSSNTSFKSSSSSSSSSSPSSSSTTSSSFSTSNKHQQQQQQQQQKTEIPKVEANTKGSGTTGNQPPFGMKVNNDWLNFKLKKSLISQRTANIIVIVSCTISTYLCLIMDYGDPDVETLATPIKEYHDRVVSEWLGYPVRPIIYKWEMAMRDLFNFDSPNLQSRIPPEQYEELKRSGAIGATKEHPMDKYTLPPRKKKKKETNDERLDREMRETKEDLEILEKQMNEEIKTRTLKWIEKKYPTRS